MRNMLIPSSSATDLPDRDTPNNQDIPPRGPPDRDRLLTAKASSEFLSLSIAAFWRNVCSQRLPPPVYPAPRAPRWWQSQLRAAVDATASLPAQAKAARRDTRLARLRAETARRMTT